MVLFTARATLANLPTTSTVGALASAITQLRSDDKAAFFSSYASARASPLTLAEAAIIVYRTCSEVQAKWVLHGIIDIVSGLEQAFNAHAGACVSFKMGCLHLWELHRISASMNTHACLHVIADGPK